MVGAPGFPESRRQIRYVAGRIPVECTPAINNGMDAPTRTGIKCAKVAVLTHHLNREERHHEDYNCWY